MDKDDISIFTEVVDKYTNGDDFCVKATIIFNGNSFMSHAIDISLEKAEDKAIQRSINNINKQERDD